VKRPFHIATADEIRDVLVTDVYFRRTLAILEARGVDKTVVAEMRAKELPNGWPWAVLAGVEEVAHLLEGLGVRVWTLREGTLFPAHAPVLTIEGPYRLFGAHETAMLGMLCQASGVATAAARCRLAAEDRTVLSFGARRMHPAITPMIDRAALLGGCDGVSVILSAELLDEQAVGTMPHALILLMGDTVEAARAFHEVIEPAVKRIILVDTFQDEKFESLRVAEALGPDLFALRLDTPGSRRGSFREILKEVRWELDLRGFQGVKLMVSGGIDEYQIRDLNPVCDGYGVGTAISNAPTVDFSFDIVEIEGAPMAKRGKLAGAKFMARCPSCFASRVVYWRDDPGICNCGEKLHVMNRLLIDDGAIVADLPKPRALRERVLEQLAYVEL
jgi:nicotinate phosphoribosyltransferase